MSPRRAFALLAVLLATTGCLPTAGPQTEVWNTVIVHPLMNGLVVLYDLLFHDFGVAILVLTILLRFLLYPVFLAQLRAQRSQQELAPALAELKKKHKDDRQRFADEQMKLYRERGVNPVSGCLPVLVQIPILSGLYSVVSQIGCGIGAGFGGQSCPGMTHDELQTVLYPFVPNPIEGDGTLLTHSALAPWIAEGLAHPDPIHILPILAGLVTLVSSLMAMPVQRQKTDDPTAATMQSMVWTTPLITVFFGWQLPAGLAIYWIASTVFSAVQQWLTSGWGRIGGYVPWLPEHFPSPSAATMKEETREVVREFERDMRQGATERERRRRKRRR